MKKRLFSIALLAVVCLAAIAFGINSRRAAVEVTAPSGTELSAFMTQLVADNPEADSYVIMLEANGVYTVEASIVSDRAVSLVGDAAAPAAIDASALESPLIQMSNTPYEPFLNEQEFYNIGNIRIANVAVKGLARQLFYANGTKYLIGELALDNSIVEIAGGNKNVFDTQGGGVIGKLSVRRPLQLAERTEGHRRRTGEADPEPAELHALQHRTRQERVLAPPVRTEVA